MLWTGTAVGAAIALLCLAPSPLRAEDVLFQQAQEKGHVLAQALCKGCHLVDDKALSPVPVGIPTFRAIANRLGQTGEKVKDVLIKPHTPMPEIQPSNDEILSIIAYLESLRTNKAVPPLLVSRPRWKRWFRTTWHEKRWYRCVGP